ncbi:MAG TPA: DUF5666 domain-containing protein [Thermoanaerobaculia bacterium]|nr:DUF5666 domain-containing protein [Thermoanaerobaculia bacterium]
MAAVLAVMLLGACSSGGMGDILGGGNSNSNYQITGTVDSVDTSNRSIWLTNVSGYSSMLSSGGGGNTVRVYYDDQTSVEWQGRSYRPQDLERGDQVSVRVDEQGNTLVAESMSVTYNAAGGMTSGSNLPTGNYGSSIRGTIRYIDTSRGTIEVSRTTGSNVVIQYGTNTPVYYNNQTYRPADLEVGDEIDVRYSDLGNGRVSAQDISVIRSISDSGSSGNTSSNYATIRGTVRSINTANRTIQLESTTWRSGFTGNTSGNLITISYDTGMNIDVNGQLQSLSGLERGDVVDVQVATNNNNSSTYWAQRIWLVRDIRN